jgi:hypothetical protein
VVVPYSKKTLTEAAVPREDRLPFRIAELIVIELASIVLTVGGVTAAAAGVILSGSKAKTESTTDRKGTIIYFNFDFFIILPIKHKII